MSWNDNAAPPAGTKCRVCGCCLAGKYVLSGGVRVPICMACDQDELCAPHKALAAEQAAAAPVPVDVEPEAAVQPAVSEPEVEQEAAKADDVRMCTRGCGAPMHRGRCKGTNGSTVRAGAGGGQAKKPGTALAKIEPQLEIEAPALEPEEAKVWVELTGAQIDRVFLSLPLVEKALGLTQALQAERE